MSGSGQVSESRLSLRAKKSQFANFDVRKKVQGRETKRNEAFSSLTGKEASIAVRKNLAKKSRHINEDIRVISNIYASDVV